MYKWTLGQAGKNKAKSKKAKMNVNKVLTKDYENKPPIRAPKKQSQTSKRQKPMQTYLPQRIMENTVISASKKQTQTNPISGAKTAGFYSYFSAKELYNRSIIESTL